MYCIDVRKTATATPPTAFRHLAAVESPLLIDLCRLSDVTHSAVLSNCPAASPATLCRLRGESFAPRCDDGGGGGQVGSLFGGDWFFRLSIDSAAKPSPPSPPPIVSPHRHDSAVFPFSMRVQLANPGPDSRPRSLSSLAKSAGDQS
ncbi:hypothetical protein Q1695_002899 [Nippostrongylus brasiliensis]|nr:hypothetical protein Q1695_002899 [Nippostrongylus brasiliensis]